MSAAAALAPAAAARTAAPSADPRLKSLAGTFRGQIIVPGTALYSQVYAPYNLTYASVHPLAVVRPVDAVDVARVVRWAVATRVPIVARSGGHSYAGYSTTRGVVVDLAQISRIAVSSTRATVGAGARLGNIYNTLGLHGRAIPAGTCPSVGIGGHALGGGFGLAARAWGLASDNIVALRIVTADARILDVDATHHSDLFWACRGGGGGNFGIVTQYVFKTHPVGDGAWFVASYDWSRVEEVVRAFLLWAPRAPDRLGTLCRLTAGPPPTLQVFGQYLGPASELQPLLAGLPAGAALHQGSESWLDLVERWAGCLGHSLPECAQPVAVAFAAASAYLGKVPSAAQLGLFREVVEDRNGPGALLVDAYGGAVNRVAPTATAFPHRRALASIQYFANGGADARAWVTTARNRLAPATTGEAYVNYIDPTLPNALHAYYGVNLPRLEQVKRRYDPHDLFRFAQAVPRA